MERLSLSASFALIPSVLYSEQEQDLWVNFSKEHIPHTQTLVAEELPHYGCVLVYDSADALLDISTDIALNSSTTANNTIQHCISYLLQLSMMPHLEGRQMKLTECPKVLLHSDENKLCLVVVNNNGNSQTASNQLATIELANIYNAQKQEDILYYTLRAYQGCHLKNDTPCYITEQTNKKAGALLKEYLIVKPL